MAVKWTPTIREQLITRLQLMKMLNISDATERRNRQGGHNWPAHILVGNRVRYRESEVLVWVEEQKRQQRHRNFLSCADQRDDFAAWLAHGVSQRWCGPPVCSTHDGIPSTDDEDQNAEAGGDPCIHIIRPYVDAAECQAVEDNHAPSVWRKRQIELAGEA